MTHRIGPKQAEPDILPPLRPKGEVLADDSLALLASLLDDVFRIPGTRIRFGLDPLIGMVPGLGDLVGGALSFMIIFAAWQRGLPRVTIGRMLANNALDALMGAIPFAGDVFDLAWKANRKNLNLLQRATERSPRQQEWRDWLFLAAVVLVAAALIVIPVAILWFVLQALRG